jgi:hypothetical protein
MKQSMLVPIYPKGCFSMRHNHEKPSFYEYLLWTLTTG